MRHRTIQGREARIHTAPDELYVEWRRRRPVYFGVRVGDHIKDADRDVESAHITEWEVVEITSDSVVGVNQKTGERQEWERRELERALVLQRYATNLSDFATVVVHAIGSWEVYERATEAGESRREPYVTVIAYGNNGEKYGRRYRFTETGSDTDLELWEEDLSIERLSPELRTKLDETIHQALEEDGYTVH